MNKSSSNNNKVTSNSVGKEDNAHVNVKCHDNSTAKKIDWFLWILVIVSAVAYGAYTLHIFSPYLDTHVGQSISATGTSDSQGALTITHFALKSFAIFSSTVFSFINKMYLGVFLGLMFAGIIGCIPQQMITRLFAVDKPFMGIVRATFLGILLDICNHGVLLVAVKLYKQGLRLGQLMAFLIATPWNSFSLTFILFSLIGVKLTLLYILFSFIIALVSGVIFEWLVQKKKIPANSYQQANSNASNKNDKLRLWPRREDLKIKKIISLVKNIIHYGLSDASFVLKWLLMGVVIVALVNTFVPIDSYNLLFGPTILGLGMTLIIATIIEVCSEGSVPLASSLVTGAGAPGNGFAFLMAGASTDLTEILILKDTLKSWKVALLLPLVTVPQILIISYFFNQL